MWATGEVMEETALLPPVLVAGLVAMGLGVDEVVVDCFVAEAAAEVDPEPDPPPPPVEPSEVMVTSESSS